MSLARKKIPNNRIDRARTLEEFSENKLVAPQEGLRGRIIGIDGTDIEQGNHRMHA